MRIGADHALNEVKYKRGIHTKDQYERAKRKLAKTAQAWLEAQGKGAEAKKQYVLRYLEDFDWKSGDTGTTMGDRSKGIVQRGGKSAKVPKGAKAKHAEKMPAASGQLKLTPKSKITLKNVSKNPFKRTDEKWAFWEVLRRTRPKSHEEAVAHLAQGLYKMYLKTDDPMSKKEAKEVAADYVNDGKLLHKFVKQGLIEVLPE